MSALRMLEKEREIPIEVLIPTIEQALLLAYQKSPGAMPQARAEVDRRNGHVTIFATETEEDGTVVGDPRPAVAEDALRIDPRPRAVPEELRRQVNVVEVPADTRRPAR